MVRVGDAVTCMHIGGQNSKHEKNKMLVEVKFGSDNVVGYNVICM